MDIDFSKHVYYDEGSPTCLRWVSDTIIDKRGVVKKRPNSSVAGCVAKNEPYRLVINKKPYPVIDVVWSLFKRDKLGGKLLHKDGNIKNCKISNIEFSPDLEMDHLYDSYLGEYLEYDETSKTHLRWKKPWRSSVVFKGDEIGFEDTNGYYTFDALGGRTKLVHKVVWALHNNFKDQSDITIDHINGDVKDNNINNLRAVSRKVNMRNVKVSKGSKTGFTGVSARNKNGVTSEYTAQVTDLNGKVTTKAFSVGKHGDVGAKWLAKQWRIERIEELNTLGAGYTFRHVFGDSLDFLPENIIKEYWHDGLSVFRNQK